MQDLEAAAKSQIPNQASQYYGSTINSTSTKKMQRNPLGDGILYKKGKYNIGDRPRFDIFIINLLLPPVVFTILIWTLGSELRYSNPSLIINVIVCTAVCSVMCLWFTLFIADRMKSFGLLLTVAVALGCLCGELNYKWNMQPIYTTQAMESRSDINPAAVKSNAISDTGKVWFSEGTYIDSGKGMSYRQDGTYYCAAPITWGSETLQSYEMWAIGIDCCSTNQPFFTHCASLDTASGSASSTTGGLRLMYPEQYQDFRLAVSQSEAAYDIVAPEKPLFFYWVSDPEKESIEFLRNGIKSKMLWCLCFFAYTAVVSPLITLLAL